MLRSHLHRPIIARINHRHLHYSHVATLLTFPPTSNRDHLSMSDPTRNGTIPPQPRTENASPREGQEDLVPAKRKSINLLRGWPATSLLPAEVLRRASQTALSDPDISTPALLYGPDPGYQPLREELARWLGDFYGPAVASLPPGPGGGGGDEALGDPSRITVTGGASQSIACILQSFTDPARTRAVWMAAPCYFLACPIFADAGFAGRLRAVPEDAEGLDVAALEGKMRALEEEEEEEEEEKRAEGPRRYKDPGPHRKTYRHVVYCVPSFSNPSGRTMSLRRREALVRLARRHDALVIADDVYDMLSWPTTPDSAPAAAAPAPLPRLSDIDSRLGPSPHDPPGPLRLGHAVSNGSFSKLVGPGVRTGWTHSSAAFATGLSKTGSTGSGGAPSQLCAAILCAALRAGDVDAHVRDVLRPAFRRRHALVAGAVARELGPLGARVETGGAEGEGEGVFGGYFLWVMLPEEAGLPPARAVAERCRADEDLSVGWGGLFEVHGDEGGVRLERGLRLCFAWEDEADLVEGVERLGRVVRRMLDEGPAGWGGSGGEKKGDVDQMK